MGPGAPMLSQASIICCPETEVRPASRAWLLASLIMKQINSVAHSCTSLFASLDILAYPTSASSLAMILAMHAIGNWCEGMDRRAARSTGGATRGKRVQVQQHLLLSVLGQTEGIHLWLLLALGWFNAVRVRLHARLLARVVGHAAGQYKALRLEGRHAYFRRSACRRPIRAAEGQGFRVAPFRSPKDALDFVAYLFLQRSILAIMNAADRRTTQ